MVSMLRLALGSIVVLLFSLKFFQVYRGNLKDKKILKSAVIDVLVLISFFVTLFYRALFEK